MHGNIKHGHYAGRGKRGSPTMVTWRAMHKRCIDPEKKDYFWRDVTVCERWDSFGSFLEDMGERPDGYTLDRINPNNGYSKANCRWACPAKQQHNRRDAKLSWEKIERIKWMRSEGFTQTQIAREFGVRPSTISRVLNGKRWKPELPVIKPEAT